MKHSENLLVYNTIDTKCSITRVQIEHMNNMYDDFWEFQITEVSFNKINK